MQKSAVRRTPPKLTIAEYSFQYNEELYEDSIDSWPSMFDEIEWYDDEVDQLWHFDD